jgi:hypothetical protein
MSITTATSRVWTSLAIILACGLGLAVTSGPISPVDVAAQVAGTANTCGDHTLRGDYGLLASGIRQVPPPFGPGLEEFTATAMWTFDGTGNFTQGLGAALYGRMSGLAPGQGEIPGTYSVNPNCTGTLALHVPQLPAPIVYAIVIVDNAREMKGIITSGHSTTTVTLTKQ